MKHHLLFLSIGFLAVSCGGGSQSPSPSSITVNGAGATFPYPIYSRWAHDYEKIAGFRLNYQSIGSGGGIAQIKAKTVDFGASDAPLDEAELKENGLVQFPLIIGGVVVVVNIEGVADGQVKLTGELLSEIYLGNIKFWDDPKITSVNQGLALPHREITVVHRADGSGTTWIFTSYLDQVSAAWRKNVGAAKAIEWPAGIGGKGNEGVAVNVQRVNGAIGYVEYAYALQNKIAVALLQNKDGIFVSPSIESFQAAAKNADWSTTSVSLINHSGDRTWPIAGASYILMHKQQPDPVKARAILDFFNWCFINGSKSAEELHYVPLPQEVYTAVKSRWKEIS